jgi:imidazolonepropionase-like amidohydrolase
MVRSHRPAVGLLFLAMVGTAACRREPAFTVEPVTGNSFVIRDARVFDGDKVIERANVAVQNGRITSVGRNLSRDLPMIDGKGKTVIPGLIDAHAHIQNSSHLRDGLRFGVTTMLDMFTRPEFAAAQRPRRDSIIRTEFADMYSSGVPITSPNGMGTQFGIPLTTISGPNEAAANVGERIAQGSDYVKIMYEPNAKLFSTISEQTLGAVVKAIRDRGKLSVVHVTAMSGGRDVARARADGLAHLFSDSILDSSTTTDIARSGMFVIPTLSIHFAFEGSDFRRRLIDDPRIAPFLSARQRAQHSGPSPSKDSPMGPYLARFASDRAMENARRLHKAGVRLFAGDDAASDLAGIGVSLHGELELLTIAGLTPAEALHAATAGPAAAFGLGDRGRVTPGARADLLLIDGNPLTDITVTRAISRVFKNGFEVSRTPSPDPAPKPNNR